MGGEAWAGGVEGKAGACISQGGMRAGVLTGPSEEAGPEPSFSVLPRRSCSFTFLPSGTFSSAKTALDRAVPVQNLAASLLARGHVSWDSQKQRAIT